MDDTINTVAEVGQSLEPYAKLMKNLSSLVQAIRGENDSDGSEASLGIEHTELLEIVLAAQSAALEAQSNQAVQSVRIRELEEELSQHDDWKKEEQRYYLKQVGSAGYVYCLKDKHISNDEPRHFICPTCAGNGKKSLVHQENTITSQNQLKCPACNTKIAFSWRYLDSDSSA